jgi:hypothetical protein
MPQQQWNCPFCTTSSLRPQGLAAHIRYGHSKQYQKWLNNPQRLKEAQQAVSSASADAAPIPSAARGPEQVEPVHTPPIADSSTAQLLHQAHAQLIARKRVIEAELARLDELKKELQTVEVQLESLDKTLAVFQQQPSAASTQARHAAGSSMGD